VHEISRNENSAQNSLISRQKDNTPKLGKKKPLRHPVKIPEINWNNASPKRFNRSGSDEQIDKCVRIEVVPVLESEENKNSKRR
jgi:hypothetical protein